MIPAKRTEWKWHGQTFIKSPANSTSGYNSQRRRYFLALQDFWLELSSLSLACDWRPAYCVQLCLPEEAFKYPSVLFVFYDLIGVDFQSTFPFLPYFSFLYLALSTTSIQFLLFRYPVVFVSQNRYSLAIPFFTSTYLVFSPLSPSLNNVLLACPYSCRLFTFLPVLSNFIHSSPMIPYVVYFSYVIHASPPLSLHFSTLLSSVRLKSPGVSFSEFL